MDRRAFLSGGAAMAAVPSVGILGFRNRILPFFRAGNMVITKAGWFIYNGTPKLGNSPISWDVSTGTGVDPFGNVLATSGVSPTGGLGVARYSANVVQQFIGIDPLNGQISLGSSGRTATYRMGAIAVQNSLPNNLVITGPFDTAADPQTVSVQLIAGQLNTHAGTLLISSPGSPSTPTTFALTELQIGSVLQTIALAILQSGDTNARVSIDQNGLILWSPGNAAGDTTLKRVSAGVLEVDTGLNVSNTFNVASLTGNHFGVDATGQLYFNTAAAIGSNLKPTASSPNIITAAGGQGAGVSGFPEISPAADFTNFTVTQAVATQITKAWSIPANDAQVGTTYRLTFFGTGTQGSTVQGLTFATSQPAGGVAIPSTFGGVSGSFNWKVIMEITVKTTGAGGTCNVVTTAMAGQGGTGDHCVTGVSAGSAFNTTGAVTFEGTAQWASTTGAPTLTCIQSRFERLGP